MQELNVMQVTRVKLRREAADVLTANAHAEVVSWLSQWTPQANFKAVVTSSEQNSLALLTADLQANLVPAFMRGKVQPHLFTFQVSSQTTENSRFWMPSSISTCTDYPIPEA